MKIYHPVIAAAMLSAAGCASEDGSPQLTSTEPTAAQIEQALSDPAYIATMDSLSHDGLRTDVAGSDVMSTEAGDWALSMPIVAVSSGITVPYEALVYQVFNGAADVSLVLAEGVDVSHGEGSPSAMPGTSTYKRETCDGWSGWRTISSYCDEHRITCWLGEATMWHQERTRICRFNGDSWVDRDHRTERGPCGC